MSISLATFVLSAIPFCEGSIDIQKCTAWMANEMIIDQAANPGHDIGYYLENSAENIPETFWPE